MEVELPPSRSAEAIDEPSPELLHPTSRRKLTSNELYFMLPCQTSPTAAPPVVSQLCIISADLTARTNQFAFRLFGSPGAGAAGSQLHLFTIRSKLCRIREHGTGHPISWTHCHEPSNGGRHCCTHRAWQARPTRNDTLGMRDQVSVAGAAAGGGWSVAGAAG